MEDFFKYLWPSQKTSTLIIPDFVNCLSDSEAKGIVTRIEKKKTIHFFSKVTNEIDGACTK